MAIVQSTASDWSGILFSPITGSATSLLISGGYDLDIGDNYGIKMESGDSIEYVVGTYAGTDRLGNHQFNQLVRNIDRKNPIRKAGDTYIYNGGTGSSFGSNTSATITDYPSLGMLLAQLDTGEVGGTTVEANPSGAATGMLTKIRIDDTIYEIEGGSMVELGNRVLQISDTADAGDSALASREDHVHELKISPGTPLAFDSQKRLRLLADLGLSQAQVDVRAEIAAKARYTDAEKAKLALQPDEPAPFADIELLPAGIEGDEYPAKITVVFDERQTSKTITGATMVIGGQTLRRASETPLSNIDTDSSGVLNFTLSQSIRTALSNNTSATDTNQTASLTLAFSDSTTYVYNIAFPVNNSNIATGGSDTGGVDQTARNTAEAAEAAAEANKERLDDIPVYAAQLTVTPPNVREHSNLQRKFQSTLSALDPDLATDAGSTGTRFTNTFRIFTRNADGDVVQLHTQGWSYTNDDRQTIPWEVSAAEFNAIGTQSATTGLEVWGEFRAVYGGGVNEFRGRTNPVFIDFGEEDEWMATRGELEALQTRSDKGDDIQSITVNTLGQLNTALTAQSTADTALLITFTATMVSSGTTYNTGDVVYLAPRSRAIERLFNTIPRSQFAEEAQEREDGDEMTSYDASSAATLTSALNAHNRDDHAAIISITADFSTYKSGERYYIAPHHNDASNMVKVSEKGTSAAPVAGGDVQYARYSITDNIRLNHTDTAGVGLTFDSVEQQYNASGWVVGDSNTTITLEPGSYQFQACMNLTPNATGGNGRYNLRLTVQNNADDSVIVDIPRFGYGRAFGGFATAFPDSLDTSTVFRITQTTKVKMLLRTADIQADNQFRYVDTNGSTISLLRLQKGEKGDPGGGGLTQSQVDARAKIAAEARYTTPEKTKLAGVEENATADQTGSEIVSAIDTQLGSKDWQGGGAAPTTKQQIADLDLIPIPAGIRFTTADGLTDAVKRIELSIPNPEILTGDVWVEGWTQGQRGLTRTKWTTATSSLRIQLTDSVASSVSQGNFDSSQIEVRLRFYDASSGGNEIERIGVNIPLINQAPDTQALTSATTIAWDVDKGNIATMTAGHNFTLTLTGGTNGTFAILRVLQDSTGSRIMTLNNNIVLDGRTAPTLSTAAGAHDNVLFMKRGTVWVYLGAIKQG